MGALLAGLAVAGAACIGNTLRCRRVHCAITGPLYLVAAGLFLARARGWDVSGGVIVAGAAGGTVLAFVPEWLGKLYFEARLEMVRARAAVAGALSGAGSCSATATPLLPLWRQRERQDRGWTPLTPRARG